MMFSRASAPPRWGTPAIPRLAAGLVLGLIALATGFAASRAPLLSLAGVLGAVLVRLAFSRFPLAIGILTASFFFDTYLASGGTKILTPGQSLGVLVALAWGLEWLVGRRRAVWDPALPILGAFVVWAVFLSPAAYDTRLAADFTRRYVSFAALYFFVVQAVDGNHRRAQRLAEVALAAAVVSATLGLIPFLSGATNRAGGPVGDPNDFGALLATVVPLSFLRLEQAVSRRGRVLATVAAVLLCATILATFSRAALVGLAVAGAWAGATGRVRLRSSLPVLAALVAVVLFAFVVARHQVETAIDLKTQVAEENVEVRFASWKIALRQFSTSPALGVGPGNSATRSLDFDRPARLSVGFWETHNAYLNVLAELGLPGAALFLSFLAVSWARLRRRLADPANDRLQAALAGGFVVALVAAMFLNEQFFPQLWLLPALGATLPPRRSAFAGPAAPTPGRWA